MAKILVVEDDEANRDFLVYVLGRAGHLVRAVSDGQAALAAVAAEPPDLVVLDVMLPEVHGYEVCHRIKQSHETGSIKVLFLSAKTFSADRHQALGVGGDGFLTKPIEPAVLLSEVAALLSSLSAPKA